MVHKNFVKRKIKLIQDELISLEKLSQYSFQEIVSDFIKQSALERILERTIIRAIDINEHLVAELSDKETKPPLSYRETFLRLVDFKIYPENFAQDIVKSVKLKNALVYECDAIDQKQIYFSLKECLEDYHKYCGYILKFLEKQKQ